MTISKEEILHVAALARLDIDDETIDKMSGQIQEILSYVDTLNRLDTEGVQCTSHAISLTNAFREDEEQGHLERERTLENAPQQEDGAFLVPKVIE
jgi:aspartyl-tRNA(Asn)/glutamyl-tRNA(Gln) amidotransferase subunit C